MSQAEAFNAVEFPESLPEKRRWLEEQIVSSHFIDFVEQLDVAVHAAKELPTKIAANQSLRSILGEQNDWLEQGLQTLNAEQVHALLKSPAALLTLNEAVFEQGGPYWAKKIQASFDQAFDAKPQSLVSPASASQATSASRASDRFGTVLAVAASVFLAVGLIWAFSTFIGNQQNQVAQGWGWERDDWFDRATDAEEYIDRLVAGAKAWHNKPVDDFAEYKARLTQLSDGCQKVIDAEHPLLSEEQKKALRELCIKWQGKFIAQIEGVTPENFQEMKDQTDQIIDKAVTALNELKQV